MRYRAIVIIDTYIHNNRGDFQMNYFKYLEMN